MTLKPIASFNLNALRDDLTAAIAEHRTAAKMNMTEFNAAAKLPPSSGYRQQNGERTFSPSHIRSLYSYAHTQDDRRLMKAALAYATGGVATDYLPPPLRPSVDWQLLSAFRQAVGEWMPKFSTNELTAALPVNLATLYVMSGRYEGRAIAPPKMITGQMLSLFWWQNEQFEPFERWLRLCGIGPFGN